MQVNALKQSARGTKTGLIAGSKAKMRKKKIATGEIRLLS
jgi:hypothetical protein